MSAPSPPRAPKRRKLFRSGHAWGEIAALLAEAEPKGRCLDLPAGRGVNVAGIRAAGFEPVAADLFPEAAHGEGSPGVKLDFNAPLPFADASFAAAVSSEGIEHHPAQQGLVQELARVVRPGGTLVITTPNVLNLRARAAAALNGQYSFKRAPISEVTGIWKEGEDGLPYVGHVHMIGYFELRFVLWRAGFRITRVGTAKWAGSCLLLAPLLWLPVQISTRRTYRRHLRGHPELADEIVRHALSPDLLFGKKLIVVARRDEKAALTPAATR